MYQKIHNWTHCGIGIDYNVQNLPLSHFLLLLLTISWDFLTVTFSFFKKSTWAFPYGTPSAHLSVSGESRCTVYSSLSPVNGSEINQY